MTSSHLASIPKSSPHDARLVVDAPGVLLDEQVGPEATGIWLRQQANQFVWADRDTGKLETVRFQNFDGRGPSSLYPDKTHLLRKHDDALELWHRSTGLVTRVQVPAAPPSPYPMEKGRPQWDGWWMSHGCEHLWYVGYDDDQMPLLYLFDGRSLELLDTIAPTSSLGYPRPEHPERIHTWGDFCPQWLQQFPGAEPVGIFGNIGDSLAFFALFSAQPGGPITVHAPLELEASVRRTSDQRVFYVQFLPGRDALLACDDLGLFTVINLPTLEFGRRFYNPLEAIWVADERLQIEPYQATPFSRIFRCRSVTLSASHVYLDMEVDEYALAEELETLGDDFPHRFFLMLDSPSLAPVGFLAPDELGEFDDVSLLDGAMIAACRDERTKLFRWDCVER